VNLLDEIIKRVGVQPESVQRAYDEQIDEAQRADLLLWAPNPGRQTDAYLSQADITLYGGRAGGGKGVRKTEPVLTPFGWRPIGELSVGSAVCAPDGTVTRIIGYFDSGPQPLYRIRFHDGSEAICDADHIWLAWTARGYRKIANQKISGESGAKKWTTRDIFDHYSQGSDRIGIPVLSQPARFNVAGGLNGHANFIGRPLTPYVLGVLLGDGCISDRGTATFACADVAIAERVQREVGAVLSLYQNDCPTYRIPCAYVLKPLDDLRLWGKRAETKKIPRQYLFAPTDDRWSLLQGLMDTDGWVDEDGDCYFCSVSEQLVDDVTDLTRSLGAIVTRREKTPFYTHNGERREGQLAYTLRVKIPEPQRMFYLERKRERCADRQQQSMARWIESIEPAGIDETVCIAVEHPQSLFVIHDFIVTHNTHLELGWGINEAQTGIIFRRELTQTDGLEAEGKKIIGNAARWNGQDHEWTWSSGKTLKLAGMRDADSWMAHAGRERDYLGFDEAGEFLEIQVAAMLAWLRSATGNRTRMILGSNPPRTADGLWLIDWFAPWLDEAFDRPAEPGELRWAIYVSQPDGTGRTVWVEGPGEYEIDGEKYIAMSRTFIPASLEDNPYRNNAEYRAKLQSLPEPLRSQLLYGDFQAGLSDQPNQVIPTEWVRVAQKRWKPQPPENIPMCAIGIDPAAGGAANLTMIPRYDNYYGEMVIVPGKDIPQHKTGSYSAGLVLTMRRDGALPIIDCSGGYGNSLLNHLADNDITAYAYKGAEKTTKRTRRSPSGDGVSLPFTNVRSAAYWGMREALDPDQPGGSNVALPPNKRLLAGLCAPTFEVTSNGIKVEPKSKREGGVKGVVERLGWSPDEADATVMANWQGARWETHSGDWMTGTNTRQKRGLRGQQPRVIIGHPAARRRR